MLMPIKLLSNLLISQIAAGEVIERPSSVIKELVENAIDAHATIISVQLIEGGLSFIIIEDNGNGIEKQQLELAVTRHATSKINVFEDLTNIASFGFRGEALAAVSSVSRFRLTSKTKTQSDYYSIDNYKIAQNENPWNIKISASKLDSSGTDSSGTELSGTTIEIEDLFHQVPVRKRFLKTSSSEQKQVLETIKHFALQHPHIAFCLTTLDTNGKNCKTLLDAKQTKEWQERLNHILGAGQFFESVSEHLKLTAWILEPTNSTNHSLYQFLFVNGRYIKDRGLQQSIRVAWQDSLHSLGNPAYALFLTIPHEEIDVNVHPAKTEIRFRHGQVVYNWVRQTMRQALRVPLNELPANKESDNFVVSSLPFSPPTETYKPTKLNTSNTNNTNKNNWVALIQKNNQNNQNNQNYKIKEQIVIADIEQVKNIENTEIPLLGTAIAQLHKTYILAENEKGLIIVDMHAAHERILLEQSREYHEKSPSQQLLIPVIIQLEQQLPTFDTFVELQNYWKSIGIHCIVDNNHLQIQITHLPTWLKYTEGQEKTLFLNAIEHFLECGISYELAEQFEQKMATWHCHRAIRHGDILTIDDMNELLRLMENTPAATRCNHGRPTWYEVSLNEINSWFLRGR